ncbi:hypothetical protein B194_3505 [Serratia plymuthica A30]|nr:hypothetical protein B194_3505 [Serratia plymuthica A30]
MRIFSLNAAKNSKYPGNPSQYGHGANIAFGLKQSILNCSYCYEVSL